MVAQSLCRVLAVYSIAGTDMMVQSLYIMQEHTVGGAVIVSGITCIYYCTKRQTVAQSWCRVIAQYIIQEHTVGDAVTVSGNTCIYYCRKWWHSHCVGY
jgi:hypothetical protein